MADADSDNDTNNEAHSQFHVVHDSDDNLDSSNSLINDVSAADGTREQESNEVHSINSEHTPYHTNITSEALYTINQSLKAAKQAMYRGDTYKLCEFVSIYYKW